MDSPNPPDPGESRSRLDPILAHTLGSLERDDPVCRVELLLRYPQFALELKELFAKRDRRERSGQLRPPPPARCPGRRDCRDEPREA